MGEEMKLRSAFQPMELMSGLDEEKFRSQLKALFEAADADKSGTLDIHEFHRLIGDSKLGLDQAQAEMLRQHYDDNQDAMISYEEFVAMAYDSLGYLAREAA